MGFIIENWFLVIVFVCILGIGMLSIKKFFLKSTESKQKIIKEIIYSLVLQAEKELGSKTGQAKLAFVIKSFYEKCPIDIRKFVPERLILDYIEQCVEKMKEYLKQSNIIKNNILNEENISDEYEMKIKSYISKLEQEKENTL